MRLRHLTTPLTIIALVATTAVAQTQQPKFSFKVDDKCLGFILDASTRLPIGSGFVLENINTVITARHVAIDLGTHQARKLMYQPPADGRKIVEPLGLTRIKDVEDADIAVMHIEGASPCKRPFKRSTVESKVGYWIVYAGFDPPTMGFKISSHDIRNVHMEGKRKFLEIEGEARPGYSGGPIFDEVGGVLGVVLKGRATSPISSIFQAISVEEIPKSLRKKHS